MKAFKDDTIKVRINVTGLEPEINYCSIGEVKAELSLQVTAKPMPLLVSDEALAFLTQEFGAKEADALVEAFVHGIQVKQIARILAERML